MTNVLFESNSPLFSPLLTSEFVAIYFRINRAKNQSTTFDFVQSYLYKYRERYIQIAKATSDKLRFYSASIEFLSIFIKNGYIPMACDNSCTYCIFLRDGWKEIRNEKRISLSGSARESVRTATYYLVNDFQVTIGFVEHLKWKFVIFRPASFPFSKTYKVCFYDDRRPDAGIYTTHHLNVGSFHNEIIHHTGGTKQFCIFFLRIVVITHLLDLVVSRKKDHERVNEGQTKWVIGNIETRRSACRSLSRTSWGCQSR